ncbi:hypothetical protein D3C71_24560 [compost metagenome]
MNAKEKFLENPNSLTYLLAQADSEDLDILVDYITDKGEGRIALDAAVCKRLVACKEKGEYTIDDRELISKEIRLFGGNTMANLYRDLRKNVPFGGVLDTVLPESQSSLDYDEIVRDVADHLKVKVSKGDEVLVMEDAVLRKLFEQAFDKMSPEEKKQVLADLNIANLSMLKPMGTAALIAAGKLGGFHTYQLALIVANAVARAILGRGLPFVVNPLIVRAVSIALGPIAWVLTGLWTIADMASPAYRVTVPCVVQLAYMRQKALVAAYTTTCPKCSAPNSREAKFCSECGTALAANKDAA